MADYHHYPKELGNHTKKMRAKKVDANQKELVKQIRQIPGATVAHLHMVGQGLPDIIIGFRGKNFFCEIKDGKKSKSQKKLSKPEEKFHEKWTGQITIIETINDVLKLLQ